MQLGIRVPSSSIIISSKSYKEARILMNETVVILVINLKRTLYLGSGSTLVFLTIWSNSQSNFVSSDWDDKNSLCFVKSEIATSFGCDIVLMKSRSWRRYRELFVCVHCQYLSLLISFNSKMSFFWLGERYACIPSQYSYVLAAVNCKNSHCFRKNH